MSTDRQHMHAPMTGWLAQEDLQRLFDALVETGYRCVGPAVRDGAIQFVPLRAAAELPTGVHDQQAPGSYRLEQTGGSRRFGWANGPQALKPMTFAPSESLWRARRVDGQLRFEPVAPDPAPTAVIGVRACDLAALRLQEAHFLDGLSPDPGFRARRDALLLIGVDCSHPAETCFCADTGDGPALAYGFDIGLTELDDGYLVRSGSPRGATVVNAMALVAVSDDQRDAAARQNAAAVQAQIRRLPGGDLRARLFERLDHRHWDAVAERCLSCGNCTAVCPTCFCSTNAADPDLDGTATDLVRTWDSCFSHGHTAMHGRPVREETCQRYRQWLTHKLAGWFDQYGRSGCVGCGRCITWCPVGIDLTAEAALIAAGDGR